MSASKSFWIAATAAVGLTLLGASGLLAGGPPANYCTSTSLQLNPNPVNEGDDVDLTATATSLGSSGSGCNADPTPGDDIEVGQLQIKMNKVGDTFVACDVDGLCTAGNVGIECTGDGVDPDCDSEPLLGDGICTPSALVDIDTQALDGDDNPFTTTFSTTGLGGTTIGCRAHYVGQGSDYKQSQSPCIDLVIEEPECTPGAHIAATFAAGDGTPIPDTSKQTKEGPWTFRISVTACGDVFDVTAQGGDNGWAPTARDESGLIEDTGIASIRKQNRRNNTIFWEIGDMADGQVANLDVVVNGNIPYGGPDCQLRYLSGPWSALSALVDGGAKAKSEYTGRVSILVDTDGDGNLSCP